MNLLAIAFMLGMAALCLFGAWQKLRDKAAPRRMPGFQQHMMTPINDPVGYRLSVALNFCFSAAFLMGALLLAMRE